MNNKHTKTHAYFMLQNLILQEALENPVVLLIFARSAVQGLSRMFWRLVRGSCDYPFDLLTF